MSNLSGKVAIVTGASRGIGRSVALGLGNAGCSIVVAAKSTESTAALPGSIYSVADEITAGRGQAFPVRVDVRDSDQIDAMVAQTVEHFGRVDILINNAGALWWQPLLETPPKRFDLVMAVNVRAAFCASRAVLPHMMKQGGGHIINFSPPIDYQALPGRIAYCVSKFGMTLLSMGLAQEAQPHNIAVTSLWPATIIESQASINWKLGDRSLWRKPQIITDCVLRIVTRPAAELSGQALIDEDFLRSQGVTDFSQYACVPGTEPPRISWSPVITPAAL
jgi:citronellol/citronellal dehydrogenase